MRLELLTAFPIVELELNQFPARQLARCKGTAMAHNSDIRDRLTISREEYADRRKQLASNLNGATAVIFAGKGGGLHDDFQPDLNFQYLTGIIDEPGAILLLNPNDPNPSRKEVLFLEPHLPELERWDGWRGPIDAKLREKHGFKALMRTSAFPQMLLNACKSSLKGTCLHPIAHHEQPVGPDLEVFQKLQQRIPGFQIDDGSRLIPSQRAVKSAAEKAMIERSAEITAKGFTAILEKLTPGITEFDIQEAAEHAYRSHGSRGPFYGSIVGSGFNATILHYRSNDAVIADGDLVCEVKSIDGDVIDAKCKNSLDLEENV